MIMLLYNLISILICGIGLKDKLQKFQNRAARVITGAIYDIRSSDILENLSLR